MTADDLAAAALAAAGIPYPLAARIQRAVATGGTTTADHLAALGVSGPTAIELARQVNARSIDPARLLAVGITPSAVMALVVAIPDVPAGFVALLGPDGAQLLGADGARLSGKAA